MIVKVTDTQAGSLDVVWRNVPGSIPRALHFESLEEAVTWTAALAIELARIREARELAGELVDLDNGPLGTAPADR